MGNRECTIDEISKHFDLEEAKKYERKIDTSKCFDLDKGYFRTVSDGRLFE